MQYKVYNGWLYVTRPAKAAHFVFVTGPDKTGLIALLPYFAFREIRISILNALCFSGGLIQSHQISCIIMLL